MADGVLDIAKQRSDAESELVDLAEYPVPLLDEALPPYFGQYQNDHTKAWASKIAEFDGFVFVTLEYNHSTTGGLKNALDYPYAEWNNKAAGFVGYGSGGGTRAVEHLLLIASELQVATVRAQVALSLLTDFENDSVFKPGPHHRAAAEAMSTRSSAGRRLCSRCAPPPDQPPSPAPRARAAALRRRRSGSEVGSRGVAEGPAENVDEGAGRRPSAPMGHGGHGCSVGQQDEGVMKP